MNVSTAKIISIRVGFSNSVLLVNGYNSIIIDTGVKGFLYHFKILFKKFGLTPADIKLIVLTHTHYDHSGNLSALAKLSRAKVLVHKNEFENNENEFDEIDNKFRQNSLIQIKNLTE